MREYELTVVYDLAVMEAGGPDASVQQLTHVVESRGGKVLRTDHWGRRRMAYPIRRAIDADYIVTRIELDPTAVEPLESTLRIDERVLRHLIVRADELPPPAPPREQRPAAVEAAAPDAVAESTPEAAAPAESLPASEPVSAAEAVTAEQPVPAEEVVSPEAGTSELGAEAVDESTGSGAEASQSQTESGAPTDETTA